MILGIIQARSSSTRLPGKVLLPLLGKPMITRQLERIARSTLLDKMIVATSTDRSDDPLAELVEALGYECHRGSLNDVLDRFHSAALPYHADHIVRLTGDCPLIDPVIIDRTIACHLEGGYDYTTNAFDPTFPDGLDVEIFRSELLTTAWHEASLPSQREHVTPYMHQNPERFRIGKYKQEQDLSHLRWTVDEPADFELVTGIYQGIYPDKPDFLMKDVLAWLRAHPEHGKVNSQFERNEGYKKSLLEDSHNK